MPVEVNGRILLSLPEAAQKIPGLKYQSLWDFLKRGRWTGYRHYQGRKWVAADDIPQLRAELVRMKLLPSDKQIAALQEALADVERWLAKRARSGIDPEETSVPQTQFPRE